MLTYPRGSVARLSDHFTAREFECRCGDCPETLIDPMLVSLLEAMRTILGQPIPIHSGYRCAARQDLMRKTGFPTSVGTSPHEMGIAADIAIREMPGHELAVIAERAGFESIGIASNWIHVDTREGRRRWHYP